MLEGCLDLPRQRFSSTPSFTGRPADGRGCPVQAIVGQQTADTPIQRHDSNQWT